VCAHTDARVRVAGRGPADEVEAGVAGKLAAARVGLGVGRARARDRARPVGDRLACCEVRK
jgi:hypothetical protein